jgi:hypothetical protein
MTVGISTILKRGLRPLAVAAAIGLGALSVAAPANAHGGWHGGWGWHGWGWGGPRYFFSLGYPLYYPAYYYPPYYYPPYPVYSYYAAPYYYYPPSPPPTVAQGPSGPPPQQNWYYCDNPHGYYPYVQSCSSGWRAVPVQPPGTHATN